MFDIVHFICKYNISLNDLSDYYHFENKFKIIKTLINTITIWRSSDTGANHHVHFHVDEYIEQISSSNNSSITIYTDSCGRTIKIYHDNISLLFYISCECRNR